MGSHVPGRLRAPAGTITARAAAEPRGRGVGAGRDAALAGRDRSGHRDPLRDRLLPREPRGRLPGLPRALPAGRARRRDHARRLARGARRARAGRRPRPHPRARGARPGDRERGPLRADRARDGDAARPRPRGRRDRPARTGPARRDHRPRRPGRADRLRPRPAAGHERLQPHRRAAEGELRADHAPVRGRRRRHRLPHRLQGARQAHVGLPAGEPDHHRRPAVDGEVGARAEHGAEPRRPARRPGGALHARDVEERGDAADDVQRGEGRVAEPAHRQAEARGLAAPDGRRATS